MTEMYEINAGISELDIPMSEIPEIGFPNFGNSGIGFPNVGNSGISLPQSMNFRNWLRHIPEIPAPGLKATYIRFKRT